MKQKRKLRIFISNTFYPAKEPGDNEEGSVASWELRVEGRLLEDSKNEPNKANSKIFLKKKKNSILIFQIFIFRLKENSHLFLNH